MSVEQNKATLSRFHEEVFNQGNLDMAAEFLAADFVDHAAPPGLPPGPEGVKQMAAMFRSAFPDLHFTEEDVIGEGDKVAVRLTIRGTHKGELMGMPPTGKQMTITSTGVIRFAEGKMVEHWENYDQLGMMQQLGAIPAPGQDEG